MGLVAEELLVMAIGLLCIYYFGSLFIVLRLPKPFSSARFWYKIWTRSRIGMYGVILISPTFLILNTHETLSGAAQSRMFLVSKDVSKLCVQRTYTSCWSYACFNHPHARIRPIARPVPPPHATCALRRRAHTRCPPGPAALARTGAHTRVARLLGHLRHS
jgi:hypothetical protein